VDVEDYFHVEAFVRHIRQEDWLRLEPRVERNVDVTLALFDEAGVKATFFVLGWVAERYPSIVPRIAGAGHEIACHGFEHRRIKTQGPDRCREDIRRSKGVLESQAGVAVTSYRAPSFSVVAETLWALDILVEEGFKVDSSIFPVRHDLYGVPDAPRGPHVRRTPGDASIVEFPPSTIRFAGHNFGLAGGGYLRLVPYPITQWAIRRLNRVEQLPAMVYFHPWEIDPGQPRIKGAGLKSRLRHYTNLSLMESKLRRLIREFRFGTLSAVLATLPFDSQ